MNLALAGAIVTLAIFVAGVIFRMGHQSARIEELERWRGSIRQDMQQISEILGNVGIELKRLATLIEERTSRQRWRDTP